MRLSLTQMKTKWSLEPHTPNQHIKLDFIKNLGYILNWISLKIRIRDLVFSSASVSP